MKDFKRHFPDLRSAIVGAILLLLTTPLTVSAQVERYEIRPGSEIVFESKAPLETFHGRTGNIFGWFEMDLADPVGNLKMHLTVDLASFDTGMKKRNRHMRENHLETELYPQAFLRGGEITSTRFENGATVFTVNGELDLHGVRRGLTCEVTRAAQPDGSLVLTTDFVIKLSDHGIKRPRFLVMKLADEQKVSVRLIAGPNKEIETE